MSKDLGGTVNLIPLIKRSKKFGRIMQTPDDPQEIADYLVAEHGLERALQTAQEGTAAAH